MNDGQVFVALSTAIAALFAAFVGISRLYLNDLKERNTRMETNAATERAQMAKNIEAMTRAAEAMQGQLEDLVRTQREVVATLRMRAQPRGREGT